MLPAMEPQLTTQQGRWRRKLERAVDDLAAAKIARDTAMRQLSASGIPLAPIAAWAGLSKGRISQILCAMPKTSDPIISRPRKGNGAKSRLASSSNPV